MDDVKEETSEDREGYAERRTDWAEDRTLLAGERTFAGWMRTGLAAVAVALGLKALFGDFSPTWVPKAAASLFVVAALFIYAAAFVQARKTRDRLDAQSAAAQSQQRMAVIAAVLGVASAISGGVLWLL